MGWWRTVAVAAGRRLDGVRQGARRRRGVAAHLLLAERGEDWAHRYLQELGWRIVARNYRRRGGKGELDLVAVDGGTLVIVEVKTRASDETGAPERAVDTEKERLIGRTAAEYVRFAAAEEMPVRFDVLSLLMAGEDVAVTHWRDAFTAGPWGPAPRDQSISKAT